MKKRTKVTAAPKKASRGATTKVEPKVTTAGSAKARAGGAPKVPTHASSEAATDTSAETHSDEREPASADAGDPVDFVTLPAECTTADASVLKDRLMKLIAHPGAVTLDRGAVQRVDTATLQMLAAFVRDRRADGLAVEWSGDGAAFKNAAGLLGLSSLL